MNFSSIVGHDSIKIRLSKIIDSPGKFLFHGPPSSGKRTIALELSKYALCQGTKQDDCTCRSCQIFKQGHPDLLCIGQKGKILVEDLNILIEFVSRAPLSSNTKAIVIDNIDSISTEAANRLLKTLEESPFIYFLITSNLPRVLSTIQSRCIKFEFGGLKQEEITNILWKNFGFELTQASILGWIGSGSSSDIFSNAGLYLKYRDMSFDFISLFLGKDFINILDFIDKISKDELIIFLDMLILVLTDILLVHNLIEEVINFDRRSDLKDLSKKLPVKSLLVILTYLTQVKKHLNLNINLNMFLKSSSIKIWSAVKA